MSWNNETVLNNWPAACSTLSSYTGEQRNFHIEYAYMRLTTQEWWVQQEAPRLEFLFQNIKCGRQRSMRSHFWTRWVGAKHLEGRALLHGEPSWLGYPIVEFESLLVLRISRFCLWFQFVQGLRWRAVANELEKGSESVREELRLAVMQQQRQVALLEVMSLSPKLQPFSLRKALRFGLLCTHNHWLESKFIYKPSVHGNAYSTVLLLNCMGSQLQTCIRKGRISWFLFHSM